MGKRFATILLLILVLALSVHVRADAQAPGYAEIVAPTPGGAIQGLLTIEGSASHPLFVAYDLAFTYQQAPITTWFSIVDERTTPIVDGRLGLWDTNGISDGEYKLRLRVHLENGTTLEDIIEGVRVRNLSIIETATPSAVGAPLPTTTLLAPTSTPRPTPSAAPEPVNGSYVLNALQIGLIIGTVITVSVGVYLYVRRRIRIRWGILRMRRMLWQDERRKRRGD